jgi:hypothetical protein
MATSIDISTNSRMTWTLSDSPDIGTIAETAELKTSRSITNGTGSGEANVAWRGRVTVPAGQVYSLELDNLGSTAFNFAGKVVMQTLKDFVVINRTTANYAYVLVGVIGPNDTTGYSAKVNRGADYRVSDYLDGWPVTAGNKVVYIANPSAVACELDIGAIGVGVLEDT